VLAPGSGPGGRWFKSTRPDQFFRSLISASWAFTHTIVYKTVDMQTLRDFTGLDVTEFFTVGVRESASQSSAPKLDPASPRVTGHRRRWLERSPRTKFAQQSELSRKLLTRAATRPSDRSASRDAPECSTRQAQRVPATSRPPQISQGRPASLRRAS